MYDPKDFISEMQKYNLNIDDKLDKFINRVAPSIEEAL